MKKSQFYGFAAILLALQLTGLCALAQESVVGTVTIVDPATTPAPGESQVQLNTNGSNSVKLDVIGYLYDTKSTLSIGSTTSGAGAGRNAGGVTIVVVKHQDNFSAYLSRCLQTNKSLREVIVELYKKAPDGRTMASETIKLNNAFISQIRQYAGAVPDLSLSNSQAEEEISFMAASMQYQTTGETAAGTQTPGAKYDIKANKKQ